MAEAVAPVAAAEKSPGAVRRGPRAGGPRAPLPAARRPPRVAPVRPTGRPSRLRRAPPLPVLGQGGDPGQQHFPQRLRHARAPRGGLRAASSSSTKNGLPSARVSIASTRSASTPPRMAVICSPSSPTPEAGQVDPANARQAVHLDEPRAKRMAAVELVGSEGAHDDEALHPDVPGQECHEIASRAVRPVQVLEDQDHGRPLSEFAEEGEQAFKDPGLDPLRPRKSPPLSAASGVPNSGIRRPSSTDAGVRQGFDVDPEIGRRRAPQAGAAAPRRRARTAGRRRRQLR